MYPYIIASAFPDTKRLSTIHSLGPGLPFAVFAKGESALLLLRYALPHGNSYMVHSSSQRHRARRSAYPR